MTGANMPDTGGHDLPTQGGVHRFSYAELANRLGISGDAARQLVRRRGWQRVRGNFPGAPAIILVPEDDLTAEQWRGDRPTPPVDRPTPPYESGATPPDTGLLARGLAALEDAIAVLREQLEAERRQVQVANGRADKAEAAVAGERSRSDVLR